MWTYSEIIAWSLFFIALSLLITSIFFIAHYKTRLIAAKKEPSPTFDAQKVLAALSTSRAVLKIDVIDPADFFWRAPK